jgi:cell division protein FtsI/penicillin-binding protein 2
VIVSEMLADAVELGMRRAAVPGYRVAGKSGTAEIGDEGYRGRHAIVSFVGYGPLPDPQFVILVKLDKPTQGRWGLEVAAPAFREMAEFLIDYNALLPELFSARAP